MLTRRFFGSYPQRWFGRSDILSEYKGTSGFDRERTARLRVVVPDHVKTGKNTNGEREVALAAA